MPLHSCIYFAFGVINSGGWMCVKVCDHYGKQWKGLLFPTQFRELGSECNPLSFLMFGLAVYWKGHGGQEER